MSVRERGARAFTLIELVVVIVVLAVLSGIAIPKYLDYSATAKVSSTRATLGAVRSAIANYYAGSGATGTAAYPTLVQLQSIGVVMQEAIPQNPYVNDATIAGATWSAAAPVSGTNGWNYDASAGRFWANSGGVGENTW